MIPRLAAVLLLAIPGTALAADSIVVRRDRGCECCGKWAAQVGQVLQRPIQVIDDERRAAFRRANGVPTFAESCHTAIIDGLVIEGHVPAGDIQRALMKQRSEVRGLAAAGMPLGSPGMEVAGRQADPFDVIAFGSKGAHLFARYGRR